ncbi:MAG: hypothetical protein HQM16_08820 [Deltaproteobacteria bacterium]|nr:hypothetical protein [Deltaproteobacteria bacterium]
MNTGSKPLKILGTLKRDIPADFFKATRAQDGRYYGSPKEVVLSEYLFANI